MGVPKQSEPLAEAQDDWVKVGSIVRTTFGNQKEKYDGFKAEVVRVWSKKVKVKTLGGAAAGTEKEFDKSKISKWVEETVSPAGQGQKRSAAEAGLTQDPDASCALADDIFGKPAAPVAAASASKG